jgi:APA family basic amino acid/polyamine antiporter
LRGLFSTKPIDEILTDAQSATHTLRRALGPTQITLLGIGAVIGAGIFATIGTAAAGDIHRPGAGPALILSFVLSGVVCAFVALCYAELASLVPISGSAYTYSYATLGELIAWIIGWDLIIEYAVGNVAVAISWANYFKTFLAEAGIIIPNWISCDYQTALRMPGVIESAPHVFGVPIVFNLLAFSIVAAVTMILLIGIRESAWFNAAMVIIKLIVLTFFVVVGTRYMDADNWHPFMPNAWHGIASGAAVIFFAYIGFDAVSTVAEETKNPQRNMPIGIIASLVICTVFYVIIAAVFTGMVPYKALVAALAGQQAEPLTFALQYVNLKGLTIFFVAVGAVIAHTAVLFVFQLGQPRIFFSMARDGLLPPVFARVHPRFRTPWGATILTGLGVGIAAMFTTLAEMVDLTNIGTLFAFILVCAGVIILRVREPLRERKFKAPGGWTMPVLGALGCIGLIAYLPPTSWLRFAAWLNVGMIVYVRYGRLNSRLTGRTEAQRDSSYLAETANDGAWLALAGTVFLMVARLADISRVGEGSLVRQLAENSWWLTVPFLMNIGLLYPTILGRVSRTRIAALPPAAQPRARRTRSLAGGLVAGTSLYLLMVLFIS